MDLLVCNIFGQFNYGGGNIRYTDYCALNNAFRDLRGWLDITKIDGYFPYLFGCGLANGDWAIVSKMIDFYFPNAIICKLPEKNNSNEKRIERQQSEGKFYPEHF